MLRMLMQSKAQSGSLAGSEAFPRITNELVLRFCTSDLAVLSDHFYARGELPRALNLAFAATLGLALALALVLARALGVAAARGAILWLRRR